jgi:O-antigen/teichoic acid export membrane protein
MDVAVLLNKLQRFLSIDQAVRYSIAGKIWLLASGLLTTLLIALHFTSELQGYYYTFNAVLVVQVFAELGLSSVLVSFASHEWFKLHIDVQGRVAGDGPAQSRLISLARFSLRWYWIAGLAITLGLAVFGLLFFGGSAAPAANWVGPWLLLCLSAGLTLCFMPIAALLEGCNQVANVYKFRFAQYVVTGVVAWSVIGLGGGLWAAPLSGLAGLSLMAVLSWLRYRRFIRSVFGAVPQGEHLRWKSDILPMQWRIALSWIGGYFTFALFTPVIFHYHGAVVAGQMGMTWALVSALSTLAASWVAPKAPMFGMLIAQGRYVELDRSFWRLEAAVVAVVVAGAIALLGALGLLHLVDHPYAGRLLPPLVTAALLLGVIVQAISLPMATYLRAHKKEPLLLISVLSGLATGVLTLVLGRLYSAQGVAAAFLVVSCIVTPFVALIWQRCRVEWHAAPLERPGT